MGKKFHLTLTKWGHIQNGRNCPSVTNRIIAAGIKKGDSTEVIQLAVDEEILRYASLKREPGGMFTPAPSAQRPINRPKFRRRDVRRLVQEGRLTWGNKCRSFVRAISAPGTGVLQK